MIQFQLLKHKFRPLEHRSLLWKSPISNTIIFSPHLKQTFYICCYAVSCLLHTVSIYDACYMRYQSIIHIIGKWCLCSAVIAQAPATVSAVATNVGTATALASVTVPVFVANKKSSCSLCSCNSTSLSLLPLPLQHLLQYCSIYRKHLKLFMHKPVAVPVIATTVQYHSFSSLA